VSCAFRTTMIADSVRIERRAFFMVAPPDR
jgi:hypothetical protein